ncbi:MAG: TIGR01777 family protein [Flavobacteriales bacterium]|nr:TIGR01777 family protein [Flavobacteriales bacterium]
MKIIIAGGSGFIGESLIQHFKKQENSIYVLTRGKTQCKNSINYVNWDGISVSSWKDCLEHSDILINLSGKSINCRFTEQNKQDLIESRINPVNALNKAIKTIENPPKVFIQASAIGFYGEAREKTDESSPVGTGFLAELSQKWEHAFLSKSTPNTRKIVLRFGLALGNGGALKPLIKITKLYLGGRIGNGQTIMSWFHVDELGLIIEYLYESENLSGIFNICSPNSVTNKDFMQSLRKVLNKPWSPPVPKFIFKLVSKYIMQAEPELVLTNQNIYPKKLIGAGYLFKYKKLNDALNSIIHKR